MNIKKIKNKTAFTLAEMMIVLTVIGILTAILMPIAFKSAPDETVMKFKKYHATLATTIREIIMSNKYVHEGDLSFRAMDDPTPDNPNPPLKADKPQSFCAFINDVLDTKEMPNDCMEDQIYNLGYLDCTKANIENFRTQVDEECRVQQSVVGAQIVMYDGANIFLASPGKRFYDIKEKVVDGSFDGACRTLCIDIDGVNQGEEPFGYGIRSDGKIYTGARAKEWSNKSIQNNDN